jgi:hypothetical protein
VAVKFTFVPAHTGLALAAIVTLTGWLSTTVTSKEQDAEFEQASVAVTVTVVVVIGKLYGKVIGVVPIL